MIIVRVGLARDRSLSGGSGQQSGFSSNRGPSLGFRHSRQAYPGQSLAVEISQFIETDDGMSENVTPIELKASQSKGSMPVSSVERTKG